MKALVIGCGSIGKRHALNLIEVVNEVAVLDQDADLVAGFCADNSIKPFTDISEALSWAPDMAAVAVPHHKHLDLAREALSAGADVLIEKPISNTYEGVEELLELADTKGKTVHVVCNMRYHPAVQALKEALPKIGNVYYARAQYGNYLPSMRPDRDYKKLYCAHKDQGGGVIMDVIHEIDYLRWLFGDVDSVQCEAAKLSDLDIDVEDYAHMVVTHINNVRSEIHMDYLKPFKRRGCEIVGERGSLLWQSEGKNPEDVKVRYYDAEKESWSTVFETDALDANLAYKDMMADFIAMLQKQDKVGGLATGHDGAKALKIALAAHESVGQQGRKVKLG